MKMETLVHTEYFNLNKIANGVFAAIAKAGTGALSNAGFVDLGTELLIFDSFNTPSAAQELRKQAEGLTGKKVKYLVNSHYHSDHIFGNQVFKEEIIISTELTKNWIREKNAIMDVDTELKEFQQFLENLKLQILAEEKEVIKQSLTNQLAEMEKLLAELPTLQLVIPNLTFEKKLVIYGSERHVELYCLGGGHSPSDTFLYVPQEKAAFMGDIVTEKLHLPIIQPEEFLSTLQETKKMDIHILMPGHGEVGDTKKIDTMIQYISMLTNAAKCAHETNISIEDFVSSFVLPQKYKEWKGSKGVERNLVGIYRFYATNNHRSES
ncbi:glyoxylase-like metal-dependent hydrolase (beta-lactamase superfamily II) [Planomicrobium stackebrandtii]|uniref:Glyoxylase-like metal-dependent hydrolase (Beta-lactamase superfamily II) n=1 Tax=Planomicrobium stackebrandtii TaxID=253160 RepID=A0ABU0GY60_9BACL|nr:MBL fold metallo-hydrolase [Planomicrobium stackebrandtii]MDQ0430310.1 glyoxylase-like metal-dependent hydrolase (beta-lactamase superfamily II) [Planomicrobium stackebrandtii]